MTHTTVKTRIGAATKQAVAQTTIETGQDAVKAGIGAVTKQVVAQMTTKTGQEAVKLELVQ